MFMLFFSSPRTGYRRGLHTCKAQPTLHHPVLKNTIAEPLRQCSGQPWSPCLLSSEVRLLPRSLQRSPHLTRKDGFFQEKASAEIRGEFFRTKSRVNFVGDFLVDFSGLFPLEKRAFFLGKKRRRKSTKKSTTKFTSEFGSFVAKIHTARIRP